jgi:hypothetical protein
VAAHGARVDVSLGELETGAQALKRDTGANLSPMVRRIAKLQAGVSERFEL